MVQPARTRGPVPTPDLGVIEAVAANAHLVVEVAEDRGADLPVTVDAFGTVDRMLDEDWFGAGPDRTDEVVTAVGCYLGQALCEDLDGVWAMDPDHGLHVRLGEVHVSPFAWVHRRLTERAQPMGERLHALRRAMQD